MSSAFAPTNAVTLPSDDVILIQFNSAPGAFPLRGFFISTPIALVNHKDAKTQREQSQNLKNASFHRLCAHHRLTYQNSFLCVLSVLVSLWFNSPTQFEFKLP